MFESGQAGKNILIRFDMDALPIHEATELGYKSKNIGKMHACGHDGHMAIGLSLAKLLLRTQNLYLEKSILYFNRLKRLDRALKP